MHTMSPFSINSASPRPSSYDPIASLYENNTTSLNKNTPPYPLPHDNITRLHAIYPESTPPRSTVSPTLPPHMQVQPPTLS